MASRVSRGPRIRLRDLMALDEYPHDPGRMLAMYARALLLTEFLVEPGGRIAAIVYSTPDRNGFFSIPIGIILPGVIDTASTSFRERSESQQQFLDSLVPEALAQPIQITPWLRQRMVGMANADSHAEWFAVSFTSGPCNPGNLSQLWTGGFQASQAPMLGRPNCCEPVFMKICAGAWLTASVCIERINAISSAQVLKCGSKSERSMPHSPCGVNFRGEPISVADWQAWGGTGEPPERFEAWAEQQRRQKRHCDQYRQRMVKRPPHILVTTPESLFILLTSSSGRNMLAIYEAVETRQPGARSGSISSVTAQPPTIARRSSTSVVSPALAR